MTFALESIKGLILDMDGVLWRGDQPLLNLPGFFKEAQSFGLKISLATNNATKSAAQYVEKLASFGAEIEPWQIINSSMAAAYYLREQHPQGGPVYIVGESGLIDSLAEMGFYPAESQVLAVVAGLDRTLTYPKLSKACTLIRSGVPFIGTNPDLTFPSPGAITPGAGSILAFIQAGSGVSPTILGKPQPFMFNLALQRMQLQPHQALAVGDRLDTDILGGQRAGCRTAAVLTGVSTLDDIHAWSPAPDLILDSLAGLMPLFKKV